MSFWKPAKPQNQGPVPREIGKAAKPKPSKNTKKKTGYSPHIAFEAKALAIEAVNSGADREDVAQILGVQPCTIVRWLDIYKKGGLYGLCRKPSTIAASKQCSALEQRIITHRKENPTHGIRRIRDNMHMYEALEVSAEKVRQTVNNAGLGNPAPKSHKRPPQIRRFERSVPNAMWQIDIFSFELKRMYKAYLIGIIDDHSRYLAGWCNAPDYSSQNPLQYSTIPLT